MFDNILENIRKNNIIKILYALPGIFIFNGFFIMTMFHIIGSIYSNTFLSNIVFFVPLVIFGWFSYQYDSPFIDVILVVINPNRSLVLKKFGSVENVEQILLDIENNCIYKDKRIMLSEKYIVDRKNYENLVECDSALGIHKFIHKVNFSIDYSKIIVTDKFGYEIDYKYSRNDSKKCDKVIYLLSKICLKAKIGYTSEQKKYISDHKVSIDVQNIKFISKVDNNSSMFTSSKMNQKYSDLIKLKELLDKNIISEEEFKSEKKKILK